ncbi:putative NIF3 family GTP cyclohydrolase 1 type 2 [Catalinimonas alkaloidigena]|uniref:Nif3-like dinuclear metal center hexameric protein n=1 Tax=Catalinimonas alkaloidigena TaxID=1075417 RepID=UPI0024059D6E|nr:Nif3-like dinuclear metal center hexameric protein [Catalinimonas alkaloidigena]MDF9799469.1 putative NIF3 family GTP cyclohydrolase 1 type 2 [Catalinimonas alkaloidigena]
MQSLRLFLLALLCLCSGLLQAQPYASPTTENAKPKAMTVGEVIERIKENLTVEWQPGGVDTIKAGDWEQEVSGIATTFMATLDVLKRAYAQGANLIITHEPTFYNHLDDKTYFEDDPVFRAKMKFIRDHNMVVWRFHDYWHMTEPDGIFVGVVRAFDWAKYRDGDQQLFDIPATNLGALASELRKKFNTSTVRVVGSADMEISRVGILPGAYGMRPQVKMIRESDIDVLIVGESAEWETIEYVRDGLEAGIQKALIVMGHADSEEPGMQYCAEWMDTFIDEVPVIFVPAGNPLWTAE